MNTTDNDVREYREHAAPGAPQPRVTPPYPGQARAEWQERQYYPEDPRRKSPVLATVMSVMPGLGQVYVGYYQQGFINVVVIATTITLIASGELRGAEPFLGLFLAFYWLYNIVDAGRRAAFYNQALAGIPPGKMPDEIKLPGTRGSFAAGVALIAAGLIFFSNTMFDVSLRWLEDWWPMGLVIAGAWLVYVSRKSQSERQ